MLGSATLTWAGAGRGSLQGLSTYPGVNPSLGLLGLAYAKYQGQVWAARIGTVQPRGGAEDLA